ALGKKDRAEYYTSLRAKAQKYFSDKFLKNGKPKEKTQCNKILALAFNLVEDKYKQKLADELEKQIRDNGNLLSCGFLGTYNLCPTLSLYGKDKMAYNLLLQRKEPSWLYSVDQGSTTIWERWNSYTKEKGFGDVGMNSFNHYAYGSVVEWMYRYMAGIEPAAPGFKELKLQPRIDLRTADELPEGQKNIKWVKASYNSASGLIRSEWNTEKGLVYKCTVPKGVKCTLTLPAVSDTITVNGVKQDISGETVDFELKGGNYTFIQK
ncbi:MAG: alpha-rhamnosidase, partial [Clostridia bacterium]|nr:alpha-rhamnosidase [Clostridia bacterium]